MTDWETAPIGDAIARRAATVDPAKHPEEVFDLYSIPAYDRGSPDVVSGAEIGSFKQVVRPGDVLLSRIVPHIRRAWVVGPEPGRRLIASGEWIVFRSEKLDPSWLRHLLLSDGFHVQFMATVAGVGGSLLRARPAHVAQIAIRIPPLDEQRRIAAILDKADAVRGLRHQTSTRLRELGGSVFTEMFGSQQYETAELSEVVRPGTIVTYGIVQAGPEYDGGVPYVRTGDIVDGAIRTTGLRHCAPAIAAKFERSRVGVGDIVMSIRATVGTTALVPPELDGANLTQGTAKISPSDVATGPYLLHYLRSPDAQRWIQAQVKGATFREITLGALRQLPIPLAPLSQQEEFDRRLRLLTAIHAHSLASAGHLDNLLASLQSRAFRGELSRSSAYPSTPTSQNA